MDGSMKLLVLIVFFRIVCMLVGMTFGLTGYLFFWRVWAEPEEDLPGKRDAWRDRLRAGAPGLGVMLLGAVITLVTLYQGIHYDLVAFSRALGGEDIVGASTAQATAAANRQSQERPYASQSRFPIAELEPTLEPISQLSPWEPGLSIQGYARTPMYAGQMYAPTWPAYLSSPEFFEFIEPEYFRLDDPLWEREEDPAILELRLLKEDLERAGTSGEPLTLRRFVLDMYQSEIVYLRKALQMAEMYDLSESEPEYFNLETPQPKIEPKQDEGEDKRMVTAKVGDD